MNTSTTLAAIQEAFGPHITTLADAIRWYASPLAQVEDFTAELTFKPGSKRPQRPLKHTLKEDFPMMENKVLEAVKEMTGEEFENPIVACQALSYRKVAYACLKHAGIIDELDDILDELEKINFEIHVPTSESQEMLEVLKQATGKEYPTLLAAVEHAGCGYKMVARAWLKYVGITADPDTILGVIDTLYKAVMDAGKG